MMKREGWKTVFFQFILLSIILLVRFYFLQPDARTVEHAGDYYQKAMVSSHGIYSLKTISVDELYTKLLSAFMLIFGNHEMSGVYLNRILQILAIVCIYLAIGFVANKQISLLIAIVICLLPFYSDKVYEISSFNLFMLLYAVGFFALAGLCKGVSMFLFKKKSTEQESNRIPDVPEEQTGVITLDDIIGGDSLPVKENADGQKETSKENEKEESEAVPAGMKEIILDEEEKKKTVHFIENPLPVPKRREHKEMDFAVDLQDDNDDYDIKDVSGMDFFDIE